MKLGGIAAVILLAVCGQGTAATPAGAPHRIMSLKLCTDELLMSLVPADRIASVSVLSREKASLKLWPQTAQIAVNHNSAEEVLATHPDLILTDDFTTPMMRTLLAKSGARIVEVPSAQTFDQIRAVTRLVGAAVGEQAHAEQLLAQMELRLHQLAVMPAPRPIRVAGWGSGGFVPGRFTLFNTVLEAAGGSNIAGAYGGYYDLEALIAARPDVLAYGDDYIDMPSLHAEQDDHPLLLKLFGGRRIIYPAALFGCGVPQSADAAVAFRAALTNAMRHPGGVP